MELFIGKQLQVVVYSFILGLIFGGLYDIIRMIHIICGIASYSGGKTVMKRGKLPFLLFFLCDAVCMITVTAAFSVFLYWQMNGTFRLFVLLSVLAGWFVYYHTAGRIVMFFSEAIVRLIRLAVLWIFVKPARSILRIVRNIAAFVFRHTAGRAVLFFRNRFRSLRDRRIRRYLRNDICFADAVKKKKESP